MKMISDASITQIVLGIPAILAAIGALYLAVRKGNIIEKKVDDTHALVNSSHGVELELVVSTLEELQRAKPDDTSIEARLAAARKASNDHKVKQAVVDSRQGA